MDGACRLQVYLRENFTVQALLDAVACLDAARIVAALSKLTSASAPQAGAQAHALHAGAGADADAGEAAAAEVPGEVRSSLPPCMHAARCMRTEGAARSCARQPSGHQRPSRLLHGSCLHARRLRLRNTNGI